MLQKLIVISVIFILVLWLVLSVVFQFYPSYNPPWLLTITRYDLFGFLPRWTFFAPNPGISDYHLLYRDWQQDGHFSDWREIPIIEARKPFSCIWNPEKRSKKILLDVTMSLIEDSHSQNPNNSLMLTLPYLILLNEVVHHGRETPGTKRQFVLVEKSWRAKPQVLFISAFHPLSK